MTLKSVASPQEAVVLAEKGATVGYQIGPDVNSAGKITKVTNTGKTILTDRNIVFKWRNAYGRFTLRGIVDSNCFVFPSVAPLKRGRPLETPKTKIKARKIKITKNKLAKRGRPLGSKNKPKVDELIGPMPKSTAGESMNDVAA